MNITLNQYQLSDILREAADLGAQNALIAAGLLTPYLSLNDAYKLYGRRSIDAFIKEGRLTPIKHGDRNSKVRIIRSELKALFTIKEFIVKFKDAA